MKVKTILSLFVALAMVGSIQAQGLGGLIQRAAASAGNLHAGVLRKLEYLILVEVFEMHGAFPVLVPIDGMILAFASYAVFAFYVNANVIIVKILPIGDERHHGECHFAVVDEICSRSHPAVLVSAADGNGAYC